MLNIPTFSSFFPHISYEPPEGTTVSGATNVISSVVNFVTGVDISDFIPYLYFNIDFSCLYNKVTRTIVSMDNSSYYLDYVFSSPGIEDENVYNIININWVILIMASCIILSKVVKVFFGLMKRSVDIMFLYLVYPAAAATIPLYGKSSFGTWVKEMVNKALSLYGLVMGINLTLILIPISMEIEIFAPTDMSGTVFGFVPSYAIPYMNAIFQIFFLVVGISFIFDSGKVIQSIIEKQKDASKASDMEKQGGDVFKGTKSVLEEAAGGVAGKNAVKAVKFVTGFIPGISAAKAAKGAAEAAKKVAEEAKEHQRKMKEMKEARKKALEKAKEQKEAKKAQKEQKKEKKNPPQGGPGNPPPDGTQNPPAAGGTGGGTPQGGPQNTPPTGAAQCGTGGGAPQNGGTGQPATAGGNSQGTQPEATAVNDADPNAEAQAKAAAAAAGEAAETKGGNGGENADASGNGAGESGQPDNGGEEGEDQDDAENNNDSDAGDSADQDDNNADKQADAAAEDLARTDKNIARNKNAQNKGLTEDIEELGKNAVEQTKTDIQNLKEEKDKDNSDK